MSLLLPPADHAAREHFDVSDLVNWKALPAFRNALASVRRYVMETTSVRFAHALTLRADGEVWLVRIGKKGGWRKVWNFGNPVP